MGEFLTVLRGTHMVAACAGLMLFWVAIVAPKGGAVHTRFGRLFCWCTFYAGTTGLYFSLWAVFRPESFFGEPIAEEELATVRRQVRFLYSITAFLALAVLSGTALGMQVARTHRSPERLRHSWVIGLIVAYGLWSVALAILGVAALAGGRGGGGVSLALGAMGAFGARGDLRQVLRPVAQATSWRLKHLECMLGAGIGYHAAAFFFGAGFLGLGLQGVMRLAPALVPIVLGVPLMWWWIAREERRLASSD